MSIEREREPANSSLFADASAPAQASAGGSFLPGRRLAAPSWVMPGGIRENIRFLTGRVDEVGLLFFETASSLAYSRQDLPDAPFADAGRHRESGVSFEPVAQPSFHVHLPMDLPMHAPQEAARICAALLEKTAYLGELRAVLHPPACDSSSPASRSGAQKQTAAFFNACLRQGLPPDRFLLENTEQNDLLPLLPLCDDYDLRICLDLGHALAYTQYGMLTAEPILCRTEMLHLSAPGSGAEKGRHLPLTRLSPEERHAASGLVRAVSRAVVMVELFSWTDIDASLPLIREWSAER